MALIRKNLSTRMAAANRVNAAKSTGPRTQRGKIQSSRNSLTFGIHSNPLLKRLSGLGEAPGEFEELHNMMVRAFGPSDTFEQMLVEDMAVIRWRRLRLYSAEGEAWHRHQMNTIKKLSLISHSREKVCPPSEEAHLDETLLSVAKRAYSWITRVPNEFGSLSEPSTRDAALLVLSLALWQFENDFAGFNEAGLEKLKTIYGPNPPLAGSMVLARYETCPKQKAEGGTQRKAEEERFLADLAKEVKYYRTLSSIITVALVEARERTTASPRGGTRRVLNLSDDHVHIDFHRDEDDIMPGEVLDRLIRYESHLERQFERKLQQLVAWRRAKGESATPSGVGP